MGGSNLPPGVTESMIPGNRPEDIAEEEFWDVLDERFAKKHKSLSRQIHALMEASHSGMIPKYAAMARDIGYERGFAEGRAEAEMSLSMIESDVAEEMQNWHWENQDATATAYLAKVAEVRLNLLKNN